MNFCINDCCLKINYFLCGSKESSSKKKRFNLQEQTIINDIRSNNNHIINQHRLSPITSYHQYYSNLQSNQQYNSLLRPLKSNKNNRTKNINSYCSIDHQIFDDSHSLLNNEIIIKDVILHRNYSNQRLGLTLSYGITSNSTTNIYIEQIDKESIADHQGELQRGDQIIKINNYPVKNREQAIQLVNKTSIIILQILRFKFIKKNLSTITPLTLTEDDSGVILGFNTDFETNNHLLEKKTSSSLSCLSSNNCSICRQNNLYTKQIKYRRCLSLNELHNCSYIQQELNFLKSLKNELIHSESLLETTTDNEKSILKPLPFPTQSLNGLIRSSKYNRRRYREERFKDLLTTDDEVLSEIKQGRYWTREQRKKQFQRSKQNKQRNQFFQQNLINSTTEDFNLLNRIFLRENEKELKEKPHLAVKYKQQSLIEKENLKKLLRQYPFYYHSSSQSTTIYRSNNTSLSTIII